MKVVIGQGSCGIASGAKKTSDAISRLIAEKGIKGVNVEVTGCIGTWASRPSGPCWGRAWRASSR